MRKHNHKMATRQLRLHPFERQRLRAIWSERTVDAAIHALAGDDIPAVVAKAGTLLYVVLGAALIENMPADTPDIRILRALANVLGECSDAPAITHQQRASLSAGLEALRRVTAAIPEETLLIAATHAQQRINSGPVTLADFQVLTQKGAA